MNNEICNQEKEVTKGLELNDKDYINMLLTYLKEMSKNYTISMTEASNENLYDKYFSVFQQISKLQRNTYELMFKNGWYKLEKSEQQKITKKYNTLNQELIDLNIM